MGQPGCATGTARQGVKNGEVRHHATCEPDLLMPGDNPIMTPENISGAFSPSKDGTVITIEVSTGSRRNCFPSGFNPWRKAIGCQVTALPLEGKANKAVIENIAAALNVPTSRVRIVTGLGSTIKRILVMGMDCREICKILRSRV